MFRSLMICLASLTIGTATLAADAPTHSAPPPLREAGDYLTNIETAVFNGPPSKVRHAVQSPAHGVLANVKATDRIPQVTGTTPITGQFPNPGSVRQVNMAGGYTATERMIENGPDGFRYQVWDLTAPSARLIEHIVGQFSYRALEDGRTEVTWSYSVAPRTFVARPFIRRFLDNDFAPFMQGGLNGAAAHFNAGG
ncbi:SRPBCC family protein [Seohaeicola saemankumensis]|nr:SRPBCC family protein [Seohaeicola saemankumensis]MCA0870923.1 SRPBCC family protein [Seohaeicola saemankumensis]